MEWKEYISSDPAILYGKPTVKGTRIAVDLLLEKLSEGETLEQLMESYPNLSKESLLACLSFAAESVRSEKIIRLAS